MTHPKLAKDGSLRARKWRVWAWQIGPGLLALSVLFMVLGMGIMLWVGTSVGPFKKEYEAWWEPNAKVRCTFVRLMILSLNESRWL